MCYDEGRIFHVSFQPVCQRHVEQEDKREQIDIVKLNAQIKEIVAREQVLREGIARIIAEIEVDT